MEPPRPGTEDVMNDHVDDVHQRPVVVGYDVLALEAPHAFREDVRQVLHVPDPGVLQHLHHVVVHEIVPERVEVDCEGRRGGDGGGEKRVFSWSGEPHCAISIRAPFFISATHSSSRFWTAAVVSSFSIRGRASSNVIGREGPLRVAYFFS